MMATHRTKVSQAVPGKYLTVGGYETIQSSLGTVFASLKPALEDVDDTWCKEWAINLRRGVAQAVELNLNRKVCTTVLFGLCNTCSDTELLVLIAELDFRNLLVVCLRMDRCNCLYNMTYPNNLYHGMHWVSQLHIGAEAMSLLDTAKACFGFATMNKRYIRLVNSIATRSSSVPQETKALLCRLIAPKRTEFHRDDLVGFKYTPALKSERLEELKLAISRASTIEEFASIYCSENFQRLLVVGLITISRSQYYGPYTIDDLFDQEDCKDMRRAVVVAAEVCVTLLLNLYTQIGEHNNVTVDSIISTFKIISIQNVLVRALPVLAALDRRSLRPFKERVPLLFLVRCVGLGHDGSLTDWLGPPDVTGDDVPRLRGSFDSTTGSSSDHMDSSAI